MKLFIESILNLDEMITRAGIMDLRELTLYSKMKEDKVPIMSDFEDENFARDLEHIRSMQTQYNGSVGEITSMQINKKKITHLVYFVEHVIIYVNLERIHDPQRLLQISEKIEDTIGKLVTYSLGNKGIKMYE